MRMCGYADVRIFKVVKRTLPTHTLYAISAHPHVTIKRHESHY